MNLVLFWGKTDDILLFLVTRTLLKIFQLVAVTAPLRNYFYRPNDHNRLQEISLNRHISPSS